jgi:hypothetical protein
MCLSAFPCTLTSCSSSRDSWRCDSKPFCCTWQMEPKRPCVLDGQVEDQAPAARAILEVADLHVAARVLTVCPAERPQHAQHSYHPIMRLGST